VADRKRAPIAHWASSRPASGADWGIDAETTTEWTEPSDRTAAVDAALVRCCRAADAVAVSVRGARSDVVLNVESVSSSRLSWDIGRRGTWTFREGTWSDEFGRRLTTGLLRPTLRGIARAARPSHESALEVLVRDVELAAGELIARAEEPRPRPALGPVPTPAQLLERTWPMLTADERADLWRRTTLVSVQGGCKIMVRDEQGRDVLFLLDGLLEVDPGDGHLLLGAGSVVGERAAMGNGIRTATVTTVTDCLLLAASGDELAALPERVRTHLDRKIVV
jgi:CRP-like cAMP-binding protein